MRAPVSWLREYVEGAPVATGREVAARLVRLGLEEEDLHGGDISGPLVVGRVLEFVEELQKNGKPIRRCQVDVGQHGQRISEGTPQGIVCGATNFAVDDLVVVVLPGAVLPGGVHISARKTYGQVSNGMICSAAELGIGSGPDATDGIIVLQSLLGDEAAATLTPGDDAIELLGLADEVVEVTVTPDRGYCLSMRGMAREYSHATGGTFRDPANIQPEPANDSGYAVQLTDEAPLNDRTGCDRYVARVVRGVDASAVSPPWMQKRLTQMGMRPISLAVDVTNYVMLLLGQPLHAFDVSTLRGPIVVRRAQAGETLKTLDDVVRTLYPQDLLITDGGTGVLAIAGVMGGATSEVAASTTDVLVEAAHFDPTSVARSSRRHRLITEASKRFERGVDPDITAVAAQLAVDLLVEFGGGVADEGVTDADHRPDRARIDLDPSLPARLVGLPYSRAEVIATLREIGCDVLELSGSGSEHGTPADSSVLSVLPPSWRPDLTNGPDFVEEVVRLRGYDQIPSVLPQAGSGRGLTHGQRVRRVVANFLAAQGFVEVLTYPFVSPQSHDDLGLPADDQRRHTVRIANPLSDEAPLMRTSVLSTLVEALRRNVSRGQRDTAIFELGLVTRPSGVLLAAPVPGTHARPDDATLTQILAAVPPQPRMIAFALTGASDRAGWWGPGRPADWADVVGAARAMASALAIELVVTADDYAPWHPGRCARLTLADGTVVGHAGELHPKVVAAVGLPPRTCVGELNVDVLTAACEARVQARELSTYPVARSDVALVVDEQIHASALESALRHGAGELLESVSLMDIYRGDQIGSGRKSLAYHLVFRAPDRTLTTKEVNGLRDQAVASAATAVGAVQR
ncbi:MAG: phenylalanine--tRNA ligase subunit beta [Phycicoccus sp.]|nr:phenylalanine--tRNA ligase subunit beta [Phycicoccus sp.]NMM32585.1 phenylalanine--tRNA ligase subunit beta [Phycicoccus sp.]